MVKIFHFDAPREKYVCDAAVVWCFDNRFEAGFRKFLKKRGVVNTDPIKIAGGAKCLASPKSESEREFVLDQIRTSIKLHGTKRAILMLHSDCGAYGGLEAFSGDILAEHANHKAELEKAANALRAVFPELDVEAYYVDFEGVWVLRSELARRERTEAGATG